MSKVRILSKPRMASSSTLLFLVLLFGIGSLLASCAPAPAPVVEQAAPAEPADRPQSTTYKVDTRAVILPPGQGIEVKYHMNEGAVMVYSWKAGAVVPSEFHGEPDELPEPGYYESHEKDDAGRTEGHGWFVSPSTGIHGWWWENTTAEPVTVNLAVAGYFDWAKQFSAAGAEDLEIRDAH